MDRLAMYLRLSLEEKNVEETTSGHSALSYGEKTESSSIGSTEYQKRAGELEERHFVLFQ